MAQRTELRVANMSGRDLTVTRPAPPGGTQTTQVLPFRKAALFAAEGQTTFDLAFAQPPDDPDAQVDFLLLNDTLSAKSVWLHAEDDRGQPLADHRRVEAGRTLRAAYPGAVRFEIEALKASP